MKLLIELLTVFSIAIGGLFAGFKLMEERHAQKTEIIALQTDLLEKEARQNLEEVEDKIDDFSKLRVYYDDKTDAETLDEADAKRKEFVNRRLEELYKTEEKMQDRLYEALH